MNLMRIVLATTALLAAARAAAWTAPVALPRAVQVVGGLRTMPVSGPAAARAMAEFEGALLTLAQNVPDRAHKDRRDAFRSVERGIADVIAAAEGPLPPGERDIRDLEARLALAERGARVPGLTAQLARVQLARGQLRRLAEARGIVFDGRN